MTGASPQVSVILPTYNEQGNILQLVDELHRELEGWEHEMLVVDDDSPDGTVQTVREAGYPFLRCIVRKEDRGLAAAIRCGIGHSAGRILVIMDTDFNHQPHYVPVMLRALESGDCVSASRFLPGGKMDSRLRHCLSGLFNIFVRRVTGSRLSDNLYGFFALKKELLDGCPYDGIFSGFGDYAIRLLCHLQKRGARIVEIPAVNGKRRSGRGNTAFIGTLCRYSMAVARLGFAARREDRCTP